MADHQEKRIKHYTNRHKILLVGEGDFSFAACLARAFGDASNMVATSLDSEVMLATKYPTTAAANLELLRGRGCTVMHGVDARSMSNDYRLLSFNKFDRIVYNFPHAGFPARETQSYQILLHQNIVRGFLENAYEMVREEGEVHITHKTVYPFSMWEIEELGRDAGFALKEKEKFYIWEYPGYSNKRGDGDRSHESFPVGECSTFKFAKN